MRIAIILNFTIFLRTPHHYNTILEKKNWLIEFLNPIKNNENNFRTEKQ